MDCFHLELAIKAQVARPTPRRAIKKWVLFLGTLNAVVIGICPFHKVSSQPYKWNYAAFRQGGFNERKGPFCVVSRDADVFACHYSHTTPSPSASFIYGYAG